MSTCSRADMRDIQGLPIPIISAEITTIPSARIVLFFFSCDKFPVVERKSGRAWDCKRHVENGSARREWIRERAKRRSVHADRAEIRKTTTGLFSSIRFELLSSRRALSIVVKNYFIIARSGGFGCSPGAGLRGCERVRTEEGASRKRNMRGRTSVLHHPRFYDLLILRKSRCFEKPTQSELQDT